MTKTVLFHELGGPEVLRVEDVRTGVPGPGEVRLRIAAVGVNRAEALFRGGHYIEAVRRFPARLGAEASGVVEAVGPGVTGWRPGQAVSTLPFFSQNDYGVYAESAIVPASAVVERPDGLGPVEGAAVWMPFLTAYDGMVEVGGLGPGGTVVVNAASSSVGLAALQVAERVGARAIAVTRTAAKREALLGAGAAEVVVGESEDVVSRVLEATGGAGAQLVFDAVAGPGLVDLARVTARDGVVVVYGALSGLPTPYPGVELGLPALTVRSYTVLEVARRPERLGRATAFVCSGLRSGSLRASIDRVFPLDAVVEAHRRLEGNGQFGKIVLSVP